MVMLVVLGIALGAGAMASSAQEPPATVISGNALRQPVRLSRTDEDDFRRRLGLPPLLEVVPAVDRDFYIVTSGYWDEAIRAGQQDELAVETTAHYFEDEGLVRARQGNDDVWLVLDLRQRAILNRYLRLARLGRLSERPGALSVLAQAWRSEEISVEVEGDLLTPLQKNIFLTGVNLGEAPSFPAEPIKMTERRGVWIVFGLQEGRSVRIFYDPDTQEFLDAYGTEVYKVHEQTVLAIAAANTPGRGPVIEEDKGRGSPVWWLIMLVAGAVGLAIAALARRRVEEDAT
jgi:hypothetical protein